MVGFLSEDPEHLVNAVSRVIGVDLFDVLSGPLGVTGTNRADIDDCAVSHDDLVNLHTLKVL